jgi:hypothetical protein
MILLRLVVVCDAAAVSAPHFFLFVLDRVLVGGMLVYDRGGDGDDFDDDIFIVS